MKNIFIVCLLIGSLAQVSLAMDNRIGLSLDAKTASYRASISDYSASANMDPMYGLGVVVKIPLRETLSLLVEGQYNSASSFTDSLGNRTNISVYPLQVSLQMNSRSLYLGGGINYTLWTVSSGSTSFDERNGIGYQIYAGLDGLFPASLEIKYTYMAASVSAFGSTFDQAASTISLGTKIWII